jgi:predicted RNA binding protein YcfA (HicA-like mRNA interferase family)
MKIPRDISGRQLVKVLCREFSYHKVHQEGSHIVLETEDPSHQRLAIPDHDSLRVGTLNNIVRSVANHKNISRDDILRRL